MVSGGCLCGTVTWEAGELVDHMTHCHCSICRKAHGAAFVTFLGARADVFRYLSGEDAIVDYMSSPGFVRKFCGTCGSSVPELVRENYIAIPAGSVDGDPGQRPSAHIYVGSKAPWHVIADDLPRYDTYENPEDDPHVEAVDHGAPTEGVLRGSCLCGGVAYEIVGGFDRIDNCHCSRCRKARTAAHATNGFTAIENVAFVRGEDRLKTFRLPGTKYFSQVFCATCGAGMPRLDPDRQVAVVPLSSLDDDPHRHAGRHIYTASKAVWDAIEDDLPKFETVPG